MPKALSNSKIQQIIKPTKTNGFCLWLSDVFLNLFKLEQIYNSILCNTMVLSSTIIIVSKMIEYGQEMPQSQTVGQPGMALEEGTQRRHNPNCYSTIYMYIFSSFFF